MFPAVSVRATLLAVMTAVTFGLGCGVRVGTRTAVGGLPGGPVLERTGVRFRLPAPAARSVQVVGNWEGNAWGGLADDSAALDRSRQRMVDPDGDGTWEAVVPLPPGRYFYSFVVDGEVRLLDPGNPEVGRWAGGEASVLVVPAAPGPH